MKSHSLLYGIRVLPWPAAHRRTDEYMRSPILPFRMYYGPEFLGSDFTASCDAHGIFIDYIEPGKPNQNAFIERFNRSYRTEVLSVYLFSSLDEVREITWKWMQEYNEERGHDALGKLTPVEFYQY
jgi:transposase InsO family protein